MRILVVGAGSVGGYFGGRLAQSGRDVTFLVRPGRADQLAARGLEIVSPLGDFTIRPKTITAKEIDGLYDIVILSVKAYALGSALADLAPAVGATTMILPVLNGMRHMDALKARFGSENVMGCVCRVATTLDDDGRIVQLNKMHDLAYGELDGSVTPRAVELDRCLQGAGFDARLSSTIAREMWEKWTQLATLGAATCLLRGNVGEIAAAPGGKDLVVSIMDEVTGIIRAVGIAPEDAFLTSLKLQMTAEGSPLTSSMYRDLMAGRPVEAEAIIGDLIQRGGTAGIRCPLLTAANIQLKVYGHGVHILPDRVRAM